MDKDRMMKAPWRSLAGTIGLGVCIATAQAQDQPQPPAPDIVIDLPFAADRIIVDHDREIDALLRRLPQDSATVTILDSDRVTTPDNALAQKPDSPAGEQPAEMGLSNPSPLADRLFPALPWHSDDVAAVPEAPTPQGTEQASVPVEPIPAPAPAPDLAMQSAMMMAFQEQKPDAKLGKSELRQLAQSYETRQYKPLWHEGADRTGKAEELLAVLRTAEEDGLDISAFVAPAPEDSSAEAIARADIALSRAVIAYARDARGARIMNPAALSKMIDAKPDVPTVEAVLAALETASESSAALQAYQPQHAGYKALKKALAKAREETVTTEDVVPAGKTLRLGQSDETIIALRRRLGVDAQTDEMLFDEPLAEALKDFQRANGIRATGVLNAVTTAALNGEPLNGSAPQKVGVAEIITNMERWRWMPANLGYNHIFVNIPEFRLTIIENNAQTHETRVVVGKPETQTPVFSDEVEFVVVNPTWTVPPSIALKEYLPKLRDNPYAMQERGFEVVRNGRPIDPGTIDWFSPPRDVAIRQPPGERNALGHIKFMLPNRHAVYLHDTPKKQYFEQDARAESHGCIRVQDPFALAEMVLGTGWPRDRVERLIGGQRERKITLARHMPVHLAYFTVMADADGNITQWRDIYRHDVRVKKALKL
jgi:L,D-transpeptidase YcbB